MNFVTKNVAEYPLQETHAITPRHPVSTPRLRTIALQHKGAQRPRARHAYRLSQIITYGVPPPQTFVN